MFGRCCFQLRLYGAVRNRTYRFIDQIFSVPGSRGLLTSPICGVSLILKSTIIAQLVRIETPEKVNQLKQLISDKQHLESALAQAHLKIVALESQLCQAEKQFGIDMKKSEICQY